MGQVTEQNLSSLFPEDAEVEPENPSQPSGESGTQEEACELSLTNNYTSEAMEMTLEGGVSVQEACTGDDEPYIDQVCKGYSRSGRHVVAIASRHVRVIIGQICKGYCKSDI